MEENKKNINLSDYSSYLKDWKKFREIKELFNENGIKLTQREWNRKVEIFNKSYNALENDLYIVHSSLGYKATNDNEEILKSINDLEKRSKNMLKKASDTRRTLLNKKNERLDL